VAATDVQVIELRLERAHDLLEMPQSDLISEYRNFLAGVDFCISALRARPSRKPVLLSITLPESEISEGLAERMRATLGRYCRHRIGYNHRERRALRYEGVTSFGIGLPITAVGLGIAVFATHMDDSAETAKLIGDRLGWVLAWVGLWYPLDVLLFLGHPYLDVDSHAVALEVDAGALAFTMRGQQEGVIRTDLTPQVVIALVYGAVTGTFRAMRLHPTLFSADDLTTAEDAAWDMVREPVSGPSPPCQHRSR